MWYSKHRDKNNSTLAQVQLTQAIKVDQSSLEYHEKSADTFNEELANGNVPLHMLTNLL